MSFTLDTGNVPKEIVLGGAGMSGPKRLNSEEEKLDERGYTVLNFIEEHFWRTGEFPSAEVIHAKCSLPVVYTNLVYQDKQLLLCLEKRSLPVDRLERPTGNLSAEQLLVANMVLNVEDVSSLRQKLKAAGVSMQKYNTWMNDPVFSGYLRKRSEEIFASTDYSAYMALAKAVEDGDMQAIKLFFEMRGIYNPRLQLDININAVMVQVVEIITKHVKDPQTIIEIASELEGLGA